MEMNSKDIKMNVLPNELDMKAQEAATAIFEMEQLLANVQDTVNRTEYYWNGEAAELNRKVFLEQKEDMEEILTRLKEYPATLRKVANIYRETEEKPKAAPWSSNLID
ncbi:MAG: WXG100 family type VII secretion target [Blautia wexlerae]